VALFVLAAIMLAAPRKSGKKVTGNSRTEKAETIDRE
jgi:hypothetical protein